MKCPIDPWLCHRMCGKALPFRSSGLKCLEAAPPIAEAKPRVKLIEILTEWQRFSAPQAARPREPLTSLLHPFDYVTRRNSFHKRQTHNPPTRSFDFFAAMNFVQRVIAAFHQHIRQQLGNQRSRRDIVEDRDVINRS